MGSGGIELQEVVCLFLITSRASFDSLQRSRMTTSRSRVPEHAAGERMVLWLSSPEKVRLEAKRLSAFKCCYCHERPGDDVHHIHPQKDGGSNDIGNAAYLCAQCHRDHGNNPDKQKRVLEARDWWYEVVRTRYAPPALDILQSFVEVVATKDDVARVEAEPEGNAR